MQKSGCSFIYMRETPPPTADLWAVKIPWSKVNWIEGETSPLFWVCVCKDEGNYLKLFFFLCSSQNAQNLFVFCIMPCLNPEPFLVILLGFLLIIFLILTFGRDIPRHGNTAEVQSPFHTMGCSSIKHFPHEFAMEKRS